MRFVEKTTQPLPVAPRTPPRPVCVETGWRWFDQADVREYNFICIQDGKADLYQVKGK